MFKKFKSLFIVEDGTTAPTANTAGEKDSGPQKQDATVSRPFEVAAASTGPGQVQDKFLEVLFEALEAKNQDGFDYMEFKEFLRSLANVPMDDSTRYKSAYATAQTMGATKEKIISSARHYLEILGQEKAKFQDALSGQKTRNLTGKQDEIKQLEKTIKQNQSEIEKLTKENETHREQIGSLEQEINSASEKLAQTASDFEATYRALLGQIELDVSNIESHL